MVDKLSWVDNLKVLGILAVILGHIASPLGTFIYSWHMPLFFILAGFFIHFEMSMKMFVVKDLKKLMIPYFIFALIGFGLEILKRIVLHRESLDYIHEIQGIFIWMDMPSLINTYAFVLWFLPTLFLGRLFVFLVNKQFKSLLFQFIIVMLFFACSFFVNLPFALDNALNSILFIFIGNIFFRFYQEDKKLYFLPFILFGLLLFLGVPSLDMANKDYENVVENIVWSISVIFVFIVILKKIDFKSKLLTIWGGETRCYYSSSIPIQITLHILLLKSSTLETGI